MIVFNFIKKAIHKKKANFDLENIVIVKNDLHIIINCLPLQEKQ